ncbi:MAG: hypothetical protein AAF456_21675 [Planctomycetota bacterium]
MDSLNATGNPSTGDYLYNQNSSITFTITNLSGTPFSFNSFLAGDVFNGGGGTVQVNGTFKGGGSISQSFNYQDFTGMSDFEVLNLNPTWVGLDSVSITRLSGNFLGIDDLQVNGTFAPIPELTSFVMGSTLLALLVRRPRRR